MEWGGGLQVLWWNQFSASTGVFALLRLHCHFAPSPLAPGVATQAAGSQVSATAQQTTTESNCFLFEGSGHYTQKSINYF